MGSIFRVFPPLEDGNMISIKKTSLFIVFALLLFTSIFTVGCGKKHADGWVNTQSMPGNTFSNHASTSTSSAKTQSSKVIYLGSDERSSSSNFGPRDVSFDFKTLK